MTFDDSMSTISYIYMVLSDSVADRAGHKYWFRRVYGNYREVALRRKHQIVNIRHSELVVVEDKDGITVIKDRFNKPIGRDEFLWIKLSSIELID